MGKNRERGRQLLKWARAQGDNRLRAREERERERKGKHAGTLAAPWTMDLTELPGPLRGRGHIRAARTDLFGSDDTPGFRLAHDVRSPLAAAVART